MKVNSFKELLLKKSQDNPNMQVLIKYMRDDFLVNHIVESLEKMAASYSRKNPNSAVLDFGTNMDKHTEGEMIHDALSHHASAYKAALAAGDKKTADKHMSQIHKMMHMSDKLTRDGLNDHSNGKLKVESIDPKPWERSHHSKTKKDAEGNDIKNSKGGKVFITNTKGWGRQNKNHNYDYLRGAPHESHRGEVAAHGHNEAYPLEEIKVNGKHVHIDDDHPYNGAYESHPFDSHPIMEHYNTSPKNHNSSKHDEYLNAVDAFNDEGGGLDSYYDAIDQRDPEAQAARGSVKHPGVHARIPGLDIERPTRETKEATAAVSPNAEVLPDKAPSLQEMKAQQKSKLQDILANAKPLKAGK